MAYLGKTPSQAVRQRYIYTASGSETSISGADDSGNTLTFTDGGYVDVYLNGVLLVAGTDYNTTTTNTIGGLTALTASDIVEIVVYDTFSVFGGDVQGDLTISNGDLNITDITAKDANGIQFNTDEGTERVRIDDSGNLLISGTNTTPNTNSAGTTADNEMALRNDGLALFSAYKATANSGVVMDINRTSTDGGILGFRKDGSTVGSIGTLGGTISIGSGSTQMLFDAGGTPSIKASTGSATNDASIDLGDSNTRFKDLYLSGGVYLGGTGAANYLDDYEEGTWTPVYNPQNGSFGTVTYDIQNGLYTKVGNIVYIELNLRTDGIVLNTASGVVRISGLPFTPSSSNPGGSLSIGYSDLFAGEEPTSALTSTSSGMIVLYYRTSSSTGTIGLNVADLGTGANRNFIFLSGVYRTDS